MKIANPIAKIGEELATRYLRKNGYKIIDRNFRKGYGEIDIVSVENSGGSEKTLVFVEVKTRTTNQFGSPLEAINYWKIKTIVKTAQFYRLTHPNLPDGLRIDAISVELTHDNKLQNLKHVKNISGY